MTDSKSVHTAPSSLLDLEDILREILLYCSKPTLAISLRVSHLFFDIAGRILYRYIHRDEATFDCVLRGVLELDGIGGGLKNQKTNKGNGKKVKEVKKGEKPNSESGIDPIPPGSPALSSSDTCSVTEQINTMLGSPGKYAYAQYLPPLSAPMLLSGTTTPAFPHRRVSAHRQAKRDMRVQTSKRTNETCALITQLNPRKITFRNPDETGLPISHLYNMDWQSSRLVEVSCQLIPHKLLKDTESRDPESETCQLIIDLSRSFPMVEKVKFVFGPEEETASDDTCKQHCHGCPQCDFAVIEAT